MKVCINCGFRKDAGEFHTSGKGLRANCKSCRAVKDRDDKLRRYYNMTPDAYETLLVEQQGVCRICRQPETAYEPKTGMVKFLSVDHDHSCCPGEKTCGQCVRGLLCSRCNTVLGMVNDDDRLLIDYILYLKESSEKVND